MMNDDPETMTEAHFKFIASQLRLKAFNTALAFGVDSSEAEDIAQDVMLKLWMMLDDLDRYRSLDSLVIVMTRHLAIDGRRREKVVTLTDNVRFILDESLSPQESLEVIENDEWLLNKLQSLPTKQYCVLFMRQVENRTYQEIARVLGIAETSARTLIARARKSLLEDFKKRI